MSGRHPILGIIEDFHLDDGRGGGPRPADDVLGTLAQVHDPNPDDNQAAPDVRVDVPEPEREEGDVEELVAQLSAQAEDVVEQPVVDVELSARLAVQRVRASRLLLGVGGGRLDVWRAGQGRGGDVVSTVAGGRTAGHAVVAQGAGGGSAVPGAGLASTSASGPGPSASTSPNP